VRLEAALTGSLKEEMAREIRAAERAVTSAVSAAAGGLKTELRAQITGAGLDQRLANTWRSETYPKGGTSISAAGFVWSKAPGLIRIYEEGATIRSTKGLFLAVPTPAAGRYGDGGKKITPAGWERRTGVRLRFIYRRGTPSLLVADNARLSKSGRAAANLGRRQGASFIRTSGRTTAPIFILLPFVRFRKRLDVAGAARRWTAALPGLVNRHWPNEPASSTK
jgi:hypothetical protein